MPEPDRSLYRLRLPSPFLADERLDVSLRNVEDGDDAALDALMDVAQSGTVAEWRASGGDQAASVVAMDPSGSIVAAALVATIDENMSLLSSVMTTPERQRDGLATAVTSLALVELAVRGVNVVIAGVTKGNEPSERLMSRFGFASVS